MVMQLPKGQPFRSWVNRYRNGKWEHYHYAVLRDGSWKWSKPKRCRKHREALALLKSPVGPMH